jgi:biotin transport system substrate-specific component
MMTEQTMTMTLPRYFREKLGARSATRNVLLVIAASLIIAASAKISVPVPFSPVPMTLQPLAILLVGAALGATRGAAAAALYLAQGAAGLPVFAHPLGLAGPTAGYLLAFPVAAGAVGWLSERGWTADPLRTIGTMTLGIAIIHLGGWSWLSATGLGANRAFLAGVAPFLIGDLLKIAIAATVLPAVQKVLPGRSTVA